MCLCSEVDSQPCVKYFSRSAALDVGQLCGCVAVFFRDQCIDSRSKKNDETHCSTKFKQAWGNMLLQQLGCKAHIAYMATVVVVHSAPWQQDSP